ncbi:MAG: glucose/arabinose dehydrogenase [Rubritalea sp.]|jgi:glucose/arabinose dehydrogenase
MKRTITHLMLALIATGSSVTAAPRAEKLIDGLKRPVCMAAPAGSTDFLYILEQPGRVRLYDRQKKQLVDKPLLDLTDQVRSKSNEQGLLGIAFSPDFESDQRFYLNYTGTEGDTVISRFTMNSAKDITEEKLLQFNQDFGNHNGGWLGFGPDGMLYIGTGDGGAANDPKARAQDLDSMLGKVLRIDVSAKTGYSIPKGNYAEVTKTEAKPEILSIGLRNPWRCSWDGDTFYIGDVGQNAHEEVNVVSHSKLAGANFGWRLREGNQPTPKKDIAGDRPENNIDPVHTYKRNDGLSITGGYVYRGKIKSLQGQYFYSDYAKSNIWSFTYKNGKATQHQSWNDHLTSQDKTIPSISSFALDPQGEMYMLSHHWGSIFKIVE